MNGEKDATEWEYFRAPWGAFLRARVGEQELAEVRRDGVWTLATSTPHYLRTHCERLPGEPAGSES